MNENNPGMNFAKTKIEESLEKHIPGFSSFKKELTGKYGYEFVKILREGFKSQLKDLKEITNFRLSLVINNNFIFGQVKRLAERNEPLVEVIVLLIHVFNYYVRHVQCIKT